MEEHKYGNDLYQTLKRTIALAVGAGLLLWFARQIQVVIVVFAAALVLAVALNPIITKLEHRRVPRWVGVLLLIVAVTLGLVFLGLLIVPRLVEQGNALVTNLPVLAESLNRSSTRLLDDYPDIANRISVSLSNQIATATRSIFSSVTVLFAALLNNIILFIILISVVLYTLANPKPLAESYLYLFPESQRDKAKRAFITGSQAASGWLLANLILGAIVSITFGVFLYFLGINGFVIWAVLAFVGEFIPRLGPLLATVPPILIALTVDPLKVIWIIVFYNIQQEVVEDVIGPYVRSKTVALHPVTVIFAIIALYYVFGVIGALIGVPVAAFAKAYYDEFYRNTQPEVPTQSVREIIDA